MPEEATLTPTEEKTEVKVGKPVTGTVTFLAPYGAMLNIGLERDALLHVSQVGRNNFRTIDEVYNVGEEVEAFILKIDDEDRIALTLEKPPALPWNQVKKDQTYTGEVVRIESYGAFVDIGAERPGMVHVSELADGYIQSPNDVVNVGDEVEVRVIKLNKRSRQIDLSMKTPVEEIEEMLQPDEDIPTLMEIAFRRAQDDADGVSRKSKKQRDRERRRQDDIISRTLRNHDN